MVFQFGHPVECQGSNVTVAFWFGCGVARASAGPGHGEKLSETLGFCVRVCCHCQESPRSGDWKRMQETTQTRSGDSGDG